MNINNSRAPYTAYNNKELIRMVDNNNNATPLERELAERLDEVSLEVQMLTATVSRSRKEIVDEIIDRTRISFEQECG